MRVGAAATSGVAISLAGCSGGSGGGNNGEDTSGEGDSEMQRTVMYRSGAEEIFRMSELSEEPGQVDGSEGLLISGVVTNTKEDGTADGVGLQIICQDSDGDRVEAVEVWPKGMDEKLQPKESVEFEARVAGNPDDITGYIINVTAF
ncbi:FxLYD domain-containing protein [Haloarcula sp. 1CSR25-25]|jgi:hypothetical protein|uniref:FxLYD domain-containing protein n=1 Tax=Haloarcula sp. 1CSR25-25 TaxID=2862545 RepID=UPI002894B111|nr:FxLYD domain-containing protein [Haloarcula sp. 1CSR25-25]MDT3437854.1 FxLYD domain-containing protein [Haloarcula sp. 1CSR25-25]